MYFCELCYNGEQTIQKVKKIIRLMQKKISNPIGAATEVLFGAHSIIEAIKAKKRKLISVYTTKPLPKAYNRIKSVLPASGNYTVNYVSREALTKICGSSEHMGVVAWFSNFVYQKNFFNPEKHPMILLLDSVQDVRNLGAILRSAHCTNFDGVVLCQNRSAPLNGAAIKASAGLAEHLSIFLAPSVPAALDLCKKAGYQVYMSVLGGKDLNSVQVQKPLCLVIGNEEKGIEKSLHSSGTLITLPQKNPEISYNASVAAGILMFYLSFVK